VGLKKHQDLLNSDPDARDLEIARCLAEYQNRRACGEIETVEQFLKEHPDLAPEDAAELEALLELDSIVEERAPLERFGDFEILREAGRGAMGIVYEARQISLDRIVALKILPANVLMDLKAVARFRREAKVAASFRHPNLVGVFAMGVEAGVPYYAMEFSDGETLRQILRRFRRRGDSGRGPNPHASTIEVLRSLTRYMDTVSPAARRSRNGGSTLSKDSTEDDEVPTFEVSATPASSANATLEELNHSYCLQVAEAFAGAAEGLQEAHAGGVIHRDLKPSNLILDSTGHLRILDFGVARLEGETSLTLTAELLGTPLYMSPEQAEGASTVGPGTDIYSLGATLYEMLVWRPPFEGRDYNEILARITHNEPVSPRRLNPQVPRDLETIVLKCLRKDPRDRYGTAEALAQDLRRFVRGDPIEARPQVLLELVFRRAMKSKRKVAEVAGALFLLFALGILGLHHLERIHDENEIRYNQRVSGAVMNLWKPLMLVPAAQANNAARRAAEAATELRRIQQEQAQFPTRFSDGSDRVFEIASDLFGEVGVVVADVGPDPVQEAVDELKRAVQDFPKKHFAYYHLARGLLLQGKKEEARACLRTALELDETFVPALSLQVLVLEKQGDPEAENLRARLARVAETSGWWPEAWLAAHEAVLERDWEKAAEAFESLAAAKLDKLYPGAMLETLLGRAVARLNAGRSSEALADIGAGRQAWSDWLEPALLLGKALYLDRNSAGAAREFAALLERAEKGEVHSPGGGALPPGDVALAVASTYRDLGDLERARDWVGKAAESPAQLLMKAEILCHLGEVDEAGDFAERAYGLQPGSSAALLTLGNVCLAKGQLAEVQKRHDDAQKWYEDARKWYRDADRVAPEDPRPLVSLGVCLEAQGDLDGATDAFAKAIERDPSFTQAHYNRARVLSRQRKLGEAIRAYRSTILVDPGNVLALNNLGTLLDRKGDLAGAREAYRRATQVAPTLALAHYNLAWALHRERVYGDAAVAYRRAIELGLDDWSLRLNVAACLFHQEKYAEAETEYRSAARLNPKGALVHRELGLALEWQQRLEEAILAYQRAALLQPSWISLLNDLGWALDRTGRLEEAAKCYRRCFELDAGFVHAHNNFATLHLRENWPIPEGQELVDAIVRLEDAALLADAKPPIPYLLEKYRRALYPDIASYASIDAVIDGPEVLVPHGATWRFLRGTAEPTPDLGWTAPSFDDSGWEKGRGAFGYPEGPGVGTVLDDMRRAYNSVYLRHRFVAADPSSISKLVLSVGADHGVVAYLNGKEVGRIDTGSAGTRFPHDAVTNGDEWHPGTPTELQIDPDGLVPGDNLLCVQAHKRTSEERHVFVDIVVEIEPVPEERERRRALDALEAFRTLVETRGGAPGRLAYFQGRISQMIGHHAEAVEWFREVVNVDAGRPEPFLRLSECLLALGDAEEAEVVIRNALEGIQTGHDRLWRRWFHLAVVELDRSPQQFLDLHSELTREGIKAGGETADLIWLVEQIEEGRPIRLNCGGVDCGTARGKVFSQERFQRGGQHIYLHRLDNDSEIEDRALYQNMRDFWEPARVIPGYAIPLPKGTYDITLHFIEGEWMELGSRRFDVYLEEWPYLAEYEPLKAGFGVPDPCSFEDVPVLDGTLNLDFKRRVGHPAICGIEIEKR
jgi:serine/threonine protein kinase/tetratricopeptide (TPR) repeat protein